tara:strand:+ start:102 stop:332 length:231 start_codon:yes stop_codon:yes gene_type:complete
MAKSKKVASLLEKKRKISKEIEDLQQMCEHQDKVIKSIRENEDSSATVIRRVCECCNKIVGMPTQQEIFNFLDGTR